MTLGGNFSRIQDRMRDFVAAREVGKNSGGWDHFGAAKFFEVLGAGPTGKVDRLVRIDAEFTDEVVQWMPAAQESLREESNCVGIVI